jgi:hypothetical protein
VFVCLFGWDHFVPGFLYFCKILHHWPKKKWGKIEYFVSKFLIFERNYSSKKVVLGQVGYISILDSHR